MAPAGTPEAASHEARAEGHGHEPANEVAVFLGGTSENDDTHFTIGAEYTRDLSDRLELGVVGEHVDGVEAWVFIAPLSFRPVKGLGLRLYGGPGLTAKVPEPGSEVHAEGEPHEGGREAFFLIRGGVGWVAEVGRVSFMPQVELDFTREGGAWQTALVFGVSAGFGF